MACLHLHTQVNGLFVFTRVGTTIGEKKKPPVIKLLLVAILQLQICQKDFTEIF